MALHHFSSGAEPAAVSAHLAQHGYAIVDDVVGNDVMDAVASEVEPHVAATEGGGDEYIGRLTRRTGALIARSPACRQLVMHPMTAGVARDFLSHASAVQLHLTQVITCAPGETKQHLHRDQMAFDMYPFPADYHVQCNTMWALTDFTADNGATHVIPGSSGVSDAEATKLPELQAEMSRGSVLFYEGKVVHGGGANRSDRPRQGVNITYCIGWVRQEENQYLATPPDTARTLDDDLLKMMGYQAGAFALGYVGDWQDPLAALRGESKRSLLIGEVADHSDDYREFAGEAAPDTPG